MPTQFQRSRCALLALAVCAGCAAGIPVTDRYTLYRGSVTDQWLGDGTLRIHVASFDAADGEAYNRENCDRAAALFQAQPGVVVRYWCEPGAYRP